MLPLETNLKEAYQKGTDDEQKFIQNLSLFLCTYLKEHGQLIERKQDLHTVLLEVSVTCCIAINIDPYIHLHINSVINSKHSYSGWSIKIHV